MYILIALILGPISTLFDFVLFALFRSSEPGVLQTMWFMGSILTELVFLFSIRTNRFFLRAHPPSLFLTGFSLAAIAATLVLPYTGFGQTLFSFIPPSAPHLITILVFVGAYFAVSEAAKLMYYKHITHA